MRCSGPRAPRPRHGWRDTGLALDRRRFHQSGGDAAVGFPPTMSSPPATSRPSRGTHCRSPASTPCASGPPLAGNLRRILEGGRSSDYKPQREALYLISTGERYALGARNGFTFEGAWVWKLKDFIDRRFMAKFNELPEMAGARPHCQCRRSPIRRRIKEISAMAMRCGGCGAKVGATILTRALGAVEPAARDDVVVGLDAPDDAAVVDTGGPRLAVHTVDYFRAILDDPYMFGKIAANHAWATSMPWAREPQTALAIATVPYGIEAKVEADLSQMMAGANDILREARLCAGWRPYQRRRRALPRLCRQRTGRS